MTHNKPSPWQTLLSWPLTIRLAWIAWALLLIGVTVRVTIARPTSQSVMPIYLLAGERWSHAELLYPEYDRVDLFRNPPIIAVGFSLLNLLPEKFAGIIFRLGNAAGLLLAMNHFRQRHLAAWPLSRVGWWYLVAALLAMPSVNNGQINILIAACVLWGFSTRNVWLCALGFGLAIWLKLYPLAAALLRMLTLPWRAALRLIFAGISVLIIGATSPFLFQSTDYVRTQYTEYLTQLGQDDRTHAIPSRVPRDWTTLWRITMGEPPTRKLATLVSLIAGCLCALVVVVRRARGESEEALLLRAMMLAHGWMTAFGPATETVTYNLLAAVAPLWLLLVRGSAKWISVIGLSLVLSAMIRGLYPNESAYTILGPQALGTILLMLVAAIAPLGESHAP
jgi:Glycosyltransferase family 87